MSGPTEQHEISEESPYAAHVDALLDRFSALVEHAQTIAFPPLRKGVTAPPDMTGWSKFRQIAFIIASPLPTTFTAETMERSSWVLLGWLIASTYWWGLANNFTGRIFGVPQPTSPKPETPLWAEIAVWPLLVLIIGLIPVAYWRLIEFCRDQRYPGIWRLILIVAFVLLVALSPYWLLKPEYREQFFPLVLQGLVNLRLLAIIYLLFVIPTDTFFYMFAIEALVIGGWLLRATVKYLWSAHNPLPREHIRELVLKPIPVGENEDEWRLAELSKAELDTLSKWAVANREGTDKRLLPTAVLFGVLGLFADTQAFNRIVDQVLIWLSGLYTEIYQRINSVLEPGSTRTQDLPLALSGKILIFVLAVGSMMLFIGLLFLLFRNLVTQSLIIEACIVAEYACEQSPASKAQTATEHKGFWTRLLRLLWRR